VKFLVDAQLPRRLTRWLAADGHSAIHTLDLPLGNRTSDNEVVAYADRESRIVVTKDDDFVQSHLVSGEPSRLLWVATGNISNAALEKLLRENLVGIEAAFESASYVELGRDALIVHE
jgi:predicted nuclease of predicted toxin-antitoxin system